MTATKPLVVSLGEPAGIGPDIILKSWERRVSDGSPFFYVNGDLATLKQRAEMLGLSVPVIRIENGSEAVGRFKEGLPVVQAGKPCQVQAGELDSENGAFVIEAIKQSVLDVQRGVAGGLVTAPIHKAALYEAGFTFPGHTEYLAALAGEFFNVTARPVMMLASPVLKVVPVTIHEPLANVPSLLTRELIVETAEIVDRDLKRRFGLAAPRLYFTGLNPHAGEDGTLGREEIEVIMPAIEALKAKGIVAMGPYSADVSFHAAARAKYDAVIAMYHDQALIPIKTLAFDEGVNVTLGLPFVRTSPDHGTALDIAGGGAANPSSFLAALKMAASMAQVGELAS